MDGFHKHIKVDTRFDTGCYDFHACHSYHGAEQLVHQFADSAGSNTAAVLDLVAHGI